MIRLIEISGWKRRRNFYMNIRDGVHVVCYSAVFDCTSIMQYAENKRIPATVVLIHTLLKGINVFDIFRTRIINDEYIACYDRIDLVSTELSDDHLFYPLYTPFNTDLQEFYESYRANQKRTKVWNGKSDIRTHRINTVTLSVLPNIRFTQVAASEDPMAKLGRMSINIGKIEKDHYGRFTVPMGVSFTHALLDGYAFFKLTDFITHAYEE